MFIQTTANNQNAFSTWEKSTEVLLENKSNEENTSIEVMDLMDILSSYLDITKSNFVGNSDKQTIIQLTKATLDCLNKLAELLDDQQMKEDILTFVSDVQKKLAN